MLTVYGYMYLIVGIALAAMSANGWIALGMASVLGILLSSVLFIVVTVPAGYILNIWHPVLAGLGGVVGYIFAVYVVHPYVLFRCHDVLSSLIAFVFGLILIASFWILSYFAFPFGIIGWTVTIVVILAIYYFIMAHFVDSDLKHQKELMANPILPTQTPPKIGPASSGEQVVEFDSKGNRMYAIPIGDKPKKSTKDSSSPYSADNPPPHEFPNRRDCFVYFLAVSGLFVSSAFGQLGAYIYASPLSANDDIKVSFISLGCAAAYTVGAYCWFKWTRAK